MLTIAPFSQPEEAHMLRLRLEAGGVPAFIQDENMAQMELAVYNAIGGVRVQIDEEDAVTAYSRNGPAIWHFCPKGLLG